ncbi:MAG: hypothetical protein H0U97_01435 [Gammaproteobacteria bacterium]|nr:hypothetical protein [Gammaproteobacteria bacterium]
MPEFNRQEHAIFTRRERSLSTLCAVNWNKGNAAERLHWSRMTLYRKMTKYHILEVKAHKLLAATPKQRCNAFALLVTTCKQRMLQFRWFSIPSCGNQPP